MRANSEIPKLEDCTAHGPDSQSELYVVEGDSAARSVLRLRSEWNQAVLPMQGKPLNAMKATAQRVERYPLFRAFRDALGIADGDTPEKPSPTLRYQRIILLFDPDADGIHCGALMLMYLYRQMRRVLESGCVYLVRAPLLEVVAQTRDGERVESFYAYTESQAGKLMLDIRRAGYEIVSRNFYRGLGSMPAQTLHTTCLAPQSRRLIPLGVREAQVAIELFSGRMGR